MRSHWISRNPVVGEYETGIPAAVYTLTDEGHAVAEEY